MRAQLGHTKMAMRGAAMALLLLALGHTQGQITAPAPPPGPSATLFEYSWSAGSLAAAGVAVAPAAKHTIASAESLCTSLPLCAGFTYLGSNSSAGEQLTMFQSTSRGNATETAWSTWAKVGILTPVRL